MQTSNNSNFERKKIMTSLKMISLHTEEYLAWFVSRKIITRLEEVPGHFFAKNTWKLWWVSSCSESFRLLEWQAENTAAGQGSPKFSESLFPDVFRNSYGTNPNLWAQKKFIKFRHSTRNTWIRLPEFFGKFISDSPFNLFRNLRDVLLSHSRIKCVLGLTVPCIFWCFSWNFR